MDGAGNDVSGQAAHIANLNPIRYRGYYYDTDLKFYYLKSRYYDPEVGRFISPDELTMAMSAANGITSPNLYTYANNNPIRYTDSGGKESVGWVETPIDVQTEAYYRGLEEHYTKLYLESKISKESSAFQLYVAPYMATLPQMTFQADGNLFAINLLSNSLKNPNSLYAYNHEDAVAYASKWWNDYNKT